MSRVFQNRMSLDHVSQRIHFNQLLRILQAKQKNFDVEKRFVCFNFIHRSTCLSGQGLEICVTSSASSTSQCMQNYRVGTLFDCLFRPDDGVVAFVGDIYTAKALLIAGSVLVALSLPLLVWAPVFGCRAGRRLFYTEPPIHANEQSQWHKSQVKLERSDRGGISMETRERIAANAFPDPRAHQKEIPLEVRERMAANM